MIDTYREQYGVIEDPIVEKAPIKNVLRYWALEKSVGHLDQLLGGQLIYKKPIDITTNIIEYNIRRDISDEGAIFQYCENFDKILRKYYNFEEDYKYWELLSLVNNENLINGFVNQDFYFPSPYGRSEKGLRLKKGMGIIKAIRKLEDFWEKENPYHTDEYLNDFLNAYSVAKSNTHIKGNLCISIHPLDFMTMSDNEANWSSCMSWKDPGDYRVGTIEMMNSSYALIAYVEDPNSFIPIGENNWNNKIWRELYLIDEKFLVNIKSYPFHCDELTKIVIDTLIKLANNNLGFNFQDKDYYLLENCIIPEEDWEEANKNGAKTTNNPNTLKEVSFLANAMYDDFYTPNTKHHFIYNKNYKYSDERISVRYGYMAVCIWCGGSLLERGNALVCDECLGVTYCAECGEKLFPDDAFTLDGNIYCYYCFHQKTKEKNLSLE